MGELLMFNGQTVLDVPPDRVLAGAGLAGLESAVVIGRLPDGELYFASSLGSLAEILMLLELAKAELLRRA